MTIIGCVTHIRAGTQRTGGRVQNVLSYDDGQLDVEIKRKSSISEFEEKEHLKKGERETVMLIKIPY